MINLAQSRRATMAASRTAWKRIVMFGLTPLGICLMLTFSVSLAEQKSDKDKNTVELTVTADGKVITADGNVIDLESAEAKKAFPHATIVTKNGNVTYTQYAEEKDEKHPKTKKGKTTVAVGPFTVPAVTTVPGPQDPNGNSQGDTTFSAWQMVPQEGHLVPAGGRLASKGAPMVITGTTTVESYEKPQGSGMHVTGGRSVPAGGQYVPAGASGVYSVSGISICLPNLPKETKAILDEIPSFREQVDKLTTGGPVTEEKVQKLREIFEQLEALQKLKKESPKAFRLEVSIIEADQKAESFAKEIRDEKDPEIKEKKTENLREFLDILFGLRQERRQVELETITAELKRVQNLLKSREEHKSEIIQRRLNQLLGDKSLEW